MSFGPFTKDPNKLDSVAKAVVKMKEIKQLDEKQKEMFKKKEMGKKPSDDDPKNLLNLIFKKHQEMKKDPEGTRKATEKAARMVVSLRREEAQLDEVHPPGRERQVKALKKKFPKSSAYAIAWASYNKSHHKKPKNEETEQLDENGYKLAKGKRKELWGKKLDFKKLRKQAEKKGEVEDKKREARIARKEETQLDESTRKHFRMVADHLKNVEDMKTREMMAQHHAEIFAKQNPRFDRARFLKAAGIETPYLGARVGDQTPGFQKPKR